jgi:hypothetical protein
MSIQDQIKEYIATQPEPKRADIEAHLSPSVTRQILRVIVRKYWAVSVHYLRTNLTMTLLGLSCCTTGKKETNTTEIQKPLNVDNEFVKYLDLLPTLSLPFETNCEKCCDHFEIHFDNELINKFRPEGAQLLLD